MLTAIACCWDLHYLRQLTQTSAHAEVQQVSAGLPTCVAAVCHWSSRWFTLYLYVPIRKTMPCSWWLRQCTALMLFTVWCLVAK
jgi:hypothetical protein